MPEETNVPISSFPDASSIDGADKVTGLQNNLNTNFKFSTILAWLVNSLKNAFVPAGRTVNNKSLASDITLTAQDVGARPDNWTPSAADVGAIPTTAAGEPLGIAELDSSGKVPTNQLPAIPSQPSDIGAQEEITASGILKGDGAGGVSAATAGTDYGTYSKPSGGIPASDLASGVVPSAYTSNPAMDGTASPGSSGAWAKGDHVHPSDTSKANQDQLAYVESGSTASRAYAVGEYFCWGGSLYRAIAYISVGATFTVGNCKATTATGMLKLFTNNFTTNANGRVSSGLYWSQGYIVAAWSQLKEIRIYSNATNAQGFWVLDNSGNPVGSTTVSITYLVYNYNL